MVMRRWRWRSYARPVQLTSPVALEFDGASTTGGGPCATPCAESEPWRPPSTHDRGAGQETAPLVGPRRKAVRVLLGQQASCFSVSPFARISLRPVRASLFRLNERGCLSVRTIPPSARILHERTSIGSCGVDASRIRINVRNRCDPPPCHNINSRGSTECRREPRVLAGDLEPPVHTIDPALRSFSTCSTDHSCFSFPCLLFPGYFSLRSAYERPLQSPAFPNARAPAIVTELSHSVVTRYLRSAAGITAGKDSPVLG